MPVKQHQFHPATNHQVRTRLLPAGEGTPGLEVIEASPEGLSRGAPILLVHGAFGGAWQWNEILMPFLARRGRAVTALSLRGHCGSEGRSALKEAGLRDFLADIRRVIATFGEAPVVVGHSMGGLLAQMLVGRERIRGLGLLASLPPEGMALEGPRLALTDPAIWTEAYVSAVARAKLPIVAASQQLLFSEDLPRERVLRYSAMMGPESPTALAEAHLPGLVLSSFLYGVPTLVLGGAADRLVTRASVLRTGFYHGTPPRILDDMGHFLMLDIGAEDVARRLLDWLEREGL